MDMNFLDNLNSLLDFYKMTKSDLSRAIGITPATINAWYNGKCDNISLSTVMKIAKYFNITMEELVNGNLKSITFSLGDFSIAELHAIIKFSEFLKDLRKENLNVD